ncbi:glycerol-3-phosphate dehydrogenase/oxidase [Maricurvus nonylphenolicus]|uniref:glycerol-3-phosphate dehydrogenase/oxidase n=1 Tax=Maricurvus nonylphenolicus TaxID=1008307 RepID=UPI0036F334CF
MGESRSKIWDSLSCDNNRHWDVIIVGGGITGAGILREAARQGLKALLVEQKDFAWGTSSRSSKMVHGGLRYLAQGDFKLTRHSLQERERLLNQAPGLVDRMGYYMLLQKGQFPGRFAMSAVLKLYDFIAGVKDNRYCNKNTIKSIFPGINDTGLTGGCYYTDAVTEDARLVLRVIQESKNSSAADQLAVLNYVKAKKLLKENGRVVGVQLRDMESGKEVRVNGSVVINATGAWADRLRNEVNTEKRVRPLRGSHLVVPHHRLPVSAVATVMHPQDGRPVFIFPWEGATVVGTTDLDHSANMDMEASITYQELDYLLELVNAHFPSAAITVKDVLATYAGVRPVISSDKAAKSRSRKPSKERRDHAVWSDDGLITVSGGKLTTFRLIAQDVLKAAEPLLGKKLTDFADDRVFSPVKTDPEKYFAIDAARAKRLLGRFGDKSHAVLSDAQVDEHGLIGDSTYCLAECRWSLRNELVVHLDDLLLRRTRLGLLLKEGGVQIFDQLKALFKDELGWDGERWQSELDRYRSIWKKHYSLPVKS